MLHAGSARFEIGVPSAEARFTTVGPDTVSCFHRKSPAGRPTRPRGRPDRIVAEQSFMLLRWIGGKY
jgi:hypothetical protein